MDSPDKTIVWTPIECSDEYSTVCSLVTDRLTRIVNLNDDILSNDSEYDKIITVFHSVSKPKVTVDFYIKRLTTCIHASPSIFILASMFIDRIITALPFVISSLSIHRLILITTILATKFLEDTYHTMTEWSKSEV